MLTRTVSLSLGAIVLVLTTACSAPPDVGDVAPEVSPEALSVATYPVRSGPAGSHYLVDQNGQPFFWSGDSAWSLIAQLSLPDAVTYLANRQSNGFNVIVVSLIEHSFASAAPANFYGDQPFTGRPFATPNEAYFARADAVLQAAAAHGIAVLLDPVYLGYNCSSEGWCAEVTAATAQDMRSWGDYVGTRYQSYDNIIWLIGGDMDPTPIRSNVLEVVNGILERDSRHLMTAHNQPESFAVSAWPNQTWLTINDVYSYSSTLYTEGLQAYQQTPVLPYFLMESSYENEHSSTPQSLRAQVYWPALMGSMGYFFGNCPIWNFGSTSSFCSGVGTWNSNLNSVGAKSMLFARQLFDSRPWQTLVPDTGHVALSSGYGTWGATNYAAAARASDGATIIAYLPSSRQVTVDLTRLSGTSAQAWWLNPGTDLATSIGSFPTTGSHSWTPPSAGDWVLVVDDAARGFAAPGVSGAPSDTLVTFEDLPDGYVLASYGGITWSSASGGWRVWDGGSTYTKTAYVNSTSRSEVTTSITLPAGQVLKSLKVAVGSGGGATVKLSSPGNVDQVWSDINGSYKVKTLPWSTPSTVVTVKITCAGQWGASDVAFDDLRYGVVDGGGVDGGVADGGGGVDGGGVDGGGVDGGGVDGGGVDGGGVDGGGNHAPTVVTPAAASPNPSTGTTTVSVLGADDGGEAALTYTWSVASAPSGGSATFSPNGTNAAKSALARLTRAGGYTLPVAIRDSGGLTATSSVVVTVPAVVTSVGVAPSSATVGVGATQQFTATALDQFSVSLFPQPSFALSVSGGGTISPSGLFTAGSSAGGPFTVTASTAGVSGTALVTVTAIADKLVNFEDLSDGATLVSYGGISWGSGSGGWRVWSGGPIYTKTAYVNSTALTEVVTSFTLPTGRVLKSLKLAVGSGGTATVKLSSAGNTERVWSDINGSYKLKTLSWTTAAAAVTVKITCSSVWGASDVAFDEFVYGAP